MSPRGRARGRRQPCSSREAQAKLRRAEQFMEVAALIKDEPTPTGRARRRRSPSSQGSPPPMPRAARRSASGRGAKITTTPKLFWN